MTTTTTKTSDLATRLEVTVAASPARVWELLTTDLSAWWPLVAGPGARIQLELVPGGRMYELGDAGGQLWGTVKSFKPLERLQILGDLFPQWGGPSRSYMTYTLTARGEGTVVQFEDVRIGECTEETAASLGKGWAFVLASLSAIAEGRPAPAWTE